MRNSDYGWPATLIAAIAVWTVLPLIVSQICAAIVLGGLHWRIRRADLTDNFVAAAKSQEVVSQRAIKFIQNNWGSLKDLPTSLIPVIWVTVYRSLEIALTVEAGGGSRALLKNTLVGDRRLMPDLEEATLRIQFLQKMLPVIRANKTDIAKATDAQLVIDILKWGILDAASMSGIKRTILRQFAKADPMYKMPIPLEIGEPRKP